MPRGKQNGLLPHVSAELKAHFLPTRGSLFMSATVLVEFPSVEGTLISGDDDPDNRHALLLTLSPLHEVGDVRVWVEKKKKVNGNTLGEWRSLQLDASTLYESRRRVVRDAGGMDFSSTRNAPPVAADSRCSLAEEEKTVVSAVEEEGEGARSEGDIDDEVLELVFETQDDDDEVDADGGNKDEDLAEEGVNISLMSGREYNEDNDSNGMGNQIVVELWTCLASSSSCTFTSAVPGVGGGECTTDESEWLISSCCIDIRLRSPTQLASLSYPPITVLSDARNIEFEQVTCDIDDDSYMLLIGQRIYDYFICPRVAYSGSGGDAVTFTVLDVYVTMISLFPEDAAPPWKVMPLCSLPVLSEDLICAFVRPEKKVDVRPVVEETHAGVSWRLQHHPSYTFMSSGTEPNMSIGMNLYFFHSDHASCDCLVPLMELAIKSWKETKSSMGSGSVVYVESDFSQKKITWVITGSSNTLLNLRRGALCTRGAVVLAVDVLRTIRKPMTSLSSLFHVDALRAKTTVLSSAFEVLWRMCKESGPVPEFHGTLVSVALTRAWAFCLLCNEFGWTELLCQERQIAFFGISVLASVDVWWLTSRYVQEAYETLLLLSSAFVVASIRHHYMYPWQLLEKQDECKPPLETVSGSNITLSSGVHVSLVHHLLLPFIQRGEARNLAAGATASPPVLFLGSLYYEEIEKDSGCRDVTLRLNCLNVNPTHSPPPPRMSSLRAPNSIWGIDVPFSLVYFDVKGSHASKTYPENVGNEKGTDLCDAHVLPCCWRVSGLSWARGMDQHTSFTVLGMGKDHKYNPDAGGNKYMRFPEEDDEEKVQENATREAFSLRVPLLVLNPKIIPAAVLLRVNHAWFWSKLSSTPESLARRIILQHIMEQAAKEGEKNIEETDLVFTPLLNQLLEELVEESCSQSFGEKRTSRVVLFLAALQRAELNSMTVRARIHPALYTRFMRLVSKRNLTAVTPLISAEKRQRDDDDVDGNEKGPVPEDVFGQKARILNHLHVLETCDASLPRENLRQGRRRQEVDGDAGGETNDGKRPRPRLILSLKKRVAAHSGEEKEAKETKRVREKAGVHDPVDVASMISRVIANTAASREGTTAPDTGGDISAARSAALSLALPLWLLLHDRPGMSKRRKTALHDVAEGMYETLRDHGVANNLDIAFLKIYECFSKRADSDETHECVAGESP